MGGTDTLSNRARARRRLAVFIAWLPAAAVIVPMVAILWRLGLPVEDAWARMVEYRLSEYLWHTVLLVTCVVTLAILFGVPAAWYMATTRFHGKRIFEVALLLPLAMPGYVSAIAYMDVLEALVPFYIWVRETFGVDAFIRVQDWVRWLCAIVVLAASLFPYVYLSCRASFGLQAAGALEAARMLGSGEGRAFRRIALPMARPAVVAGASLVGMEVINDYGVVSYFGLSPLTVGVFRLWQGEGALNAAVRLAAILLVGTLIALAIERAQRGRRAFADQGSSRPLPPRTMGLFGTGKVWLVCLLPLTLGFLLPVTRLLRWALQDEGVHEWGPVLRACWHSLSLAAGSALLIVFGVVVLRFIRRAVPARSLGIAQRLSLLGYAFPSALLAVGVAGLFSYVARFPGLSGLALSSSVAGLLCAYYVRFLAVGMQPLDAGLTRVSRSLHEVGRTLGASPRRVVMSVDLPLSGTALLAGATLAFVDVFKELTLTLVLRPFDFETLATRVFVLADEGRIPQASLPALLLVGCCLVCLIPLLFLNRRLRT